MRDKLDLKATVTHLQSNEPFHRPATVNVTQPETGTYVNHRRYRIRGLAGRIMRGRGGRDRGRGGSRGGSRGSIRKGSQGRTRYSKNRSDKHNLPRVEEPREAYKNECRFCYREDHFISNCPTYKRLQKEEERKKDNNTQAHIADQIAEASNVALADESENDSYYSHPTVATALSAINCPKWALDSGASKHFSGILADFTFLKRWSSERSVRIANGTLIPALGYGHVQIPGLLLRDVWYVPQFRDTRLISVRSLTQVGYRILFDEGDRAFCTNPKTGSLLFEARFENGLYKTCDTQEAYEAQSIGPPKLLEADNGPLLETEAEL